MQLVIIMSSATVLARHTLLWILLLSMEIERSHTQRTPLRFLSLLPYPAPQGALLSPSYDGGPNLLPAVRLAVKHVNEREGILDGYELEAVADDSGCDIVHNAQFSVVKRVFGNRAITHTARNETDIVGIVGLVCPESALAVAELTSRPQIALVNIHQASVEARPGDYSFSVVSPASSLVAALAAFIEQAGWKRIALLFETNQLFYRELYQKIPINDQPDFEFERVELFDIEDIQHGLSTVQSSGYRVILLFVGEKYASEILCRCSEMGLTFPNYQLVLISVSISEIISSGNCGDGYQKSLRGSFLFNHKLKPSEEDIFDEYIAFHEQYTTELANPPLSQAVRGALLYDSVWALALALNNSADRMWTERGVTLAEYKFGMPEVSDIISQEIAKLEFDGLSGRINFSAEDGFSTRPIAIHQIIGGIQLYAEYSSDNLTMFSSNATLHIIDDSFPKLSDGALHPAVSVVFFTFIFLHFSVLISIHIATVVFRQKGPVKASNHRMNQINIVGNYLFLVGLSLNNYIKAFHGDLSYKVIGIFCQVTWPWILNIATTLVISSIALRTWRLYRIFFHYMNPGQFISDRAFFIFLCILVGVDIALAIPWTATDPIQVSVVSEHFVDDNGHIFEQQTTMCVSGTTQIWLPLITFYKIVLIAALLTLAILTRKISEKNFTTLNLRIVSYTYFFTSGFGFPLFYFLFFINVHALVVFVVLNVVVHSVPLQNIVLVLLPPLMPVLKEKWKHARATIAAKLSCDSKSISQSKHV